MFRLLFLALREVRTTLGPCVQYVMDQLFTKVMTQRELHEIQAYYYRMQYVEQTLNETLNNLIKDVETECQAIANELDQISC